MEGLGNAAGDIVTIPKLFSDNHLYARIWFKGVDLSSSSFSIILYVDDDNYIRYNYTTDGGAGVSHRLKIFDSISGSETQLDAINALTLATRANFCIDIYAANRGGDYAYIMNSDIADRQAEATSTINLSDVTSFGIKYESGDMFIQSIFML